MVSTGKVGVNDIYHAQLSLTQSVPSHQGLIESYYLSFGLEFGPKVQYVTT